MNPLSSTLGMGCNWRCSSGQNCRTGLRNRRLHAAGRSAMRYSGVANAMAKCTRVACAAVAVLVLLGDNSAARGESRVRARQNQPSHGWDGTSSAFVRLPHERYTSRTSLYMSRGSLSLLPKARRATNAALRGSGGMSGDVLAGGKDNGCKSPAFAFSVKSRRRMGATQQSGSQRASISAADTDMAIDERDLLRSPRYAAAGEGRSYPERLQVSAATVDAGAISTESAEGIVVGSTRTSGATSMPGTRPLLPELNEEDLQMLREGRRVQRQTRRGGSGSGSVVVDVRADPDIVMDLLTRYREYPDMIDTVRQCRVSSGSSRNPDEKMVEVVVSRFSLHIRVLMTRLRDCNMVRFEMDPDCTKAGRAVLREASGFFYVESLPDRPGFTRVWLTATVNVHRFVPGAIVNYAAARALPRASSWVKPTCEAAQRKKPRISAL